MTPLGATYMSGITKARDLMDSTARRWDASKVDAMFSEDDARDIKQIAIGGAGPSRLHGMESHKKWAGYG
jgi:hypothetical protein